ncbi:MAG: DUF481 domain-containing protein [Planctomycetota bacterium]|jgi:putative salt-induced outer membrane protein YdiY
MRRSISVLVFGLVVVANSVWADEVVFKNGDRLTGKIKHVIDGKMTLESEVAGTLTIDVSTIQTFSTNEPINVHLNDGTALNQRIVKGAPSKFGIAGDQTLMAQEFELAAITSINPPAKPEPKWTGNIVAGYTSTHGNTNTDAINASVSLAKRTEKDRTQLSGDYAKGRQEDPDTGERKTTENWWRTRGKYDYFFSKKLYGYLDGRYEKDSIADLDRRVIVGGGGGYQWIESDDMNFSTELGLASVYEKYDDQSDSDTKTSVQAGYYFDKKLAKNVKFIHDLTYYPSTEKISDYYLSSTAEVRAHFTKNMFTNFKVIFNYDATPAIGKGGTDTKYLLGVGWSF